MREFILRAARAVTTPHFTLADLAGAAGRMDLVCRCVSSALWISHDLRRDTTIHVVLEGPDRPPRLISFDGARLRGVSPDERNIACHIRAALRRGLNLGLGEWVEVSPGITIAKRSFESLVKEKAKTAQLIYLHPRGEPVREFEFARHVCFVLGDHLGLPRAAEKLLRRLGARRVSLGRQVYLASHAMVIAHYELDRRTSGAKA